MDGVDTGGSAVIVTDGGGEADTAGEGVDEEVGVTVGR
jgi:accessory colonization factor AcfC